MAEPGTPGATPDTTPATTAPAAPDTTPATPDTLTPAARRAEIVEKLIQPDITPDERRKLVEENNTLLIEEVTATVTAAVTTEVKRGAQRAERRLKSQITTLQNEVSTQQQTIANYEAQRVAAEQKAQNDKRHRLVKIAAAAVGFTTTFFTPVGLSVIIGAGLLGAASGFLAKKGNEKLQQYATQIGGHAERINRLTEAARRLRANDPNRVIMQEMIQTNVADAQRIENKRKWVSRLTTGASYASSAGYGFGMGAAIGSATQLILGETINSAVGAKTAGATELGGNATRVGTGGAGTPEVSSGIGSGTTPSSLDLPGSAYHGTTLQHASPENMLPGGLENHSNFYGGNEGLAAYKFQTGVDSTGLSTQALFSGDTGAFTANAHQVINTLKANPSLDFAGAYEQVMGEPLQSIIQSNSSLSGIGRATVGAAGN